jgi:hypothetical protein
MGAPPAAERRWRASGEPTAQLLAPVLTCAAMSSRPCCKPSLVSPRSSRLATNATLVRGALIDRAAVNTLSQGGQAYAIPEPVGLGVGTSPRSSAATSRTVHQEEPVGYLGSAVGADLACVSGNPDAAVAPIIALDRDHRPR